MPRRSRTRGARSRRAHVRAPLLMVVAGAFAVAGCGSTPAERGRDGGTLRVAHNAFPDTLDPALAQAQDARQALRTVYTPLLSLSHAPGDAGATVVPGLADALPRTSPDQRTYALKLREGLRYSDGSPVHASDFEHAIKRVLRLKSAGAASFLGIIGAREYMRGADADADIAGIATSDRTNDLTISLDAPDRDFVDTLALTSGALVPGDTPFSDQTLTPPAGVGPYRFANVRGRQGYDLVKVAGFSLPEQPAGRLDRIEARVVSNRGRQIADTIDNRIDYMTPAPTPAELSAVRTRYAGNRYQQFTAGPTHLSGRRTLAAFFSDRVDTANCVVWNPTFSLDLAQLCLTAPASAAP